MARKSLLYYLFSKNNLPLYVDDNGFVVEGTDDYNRLDGKPAHLQYSPEGWKDTLVKTARSLKYWGLFRDMTVPMKFPNDGKWILTWLLSQYGIEAVAKLAMMKLDRKSLPYSYKPYYITQINFPKYKNSRDWFTVEAIEGGMSKWIKANENTKFEYDIDSDPERVTILMDGKTFDFNRTYGIPGDQPVRGDNDYYMGVVETSREGNALDVEFQDIFFQTSTAYPNDNWIIRTGLTTPVNTVRVHGTFNIHYDKTCTPFIRIETAHNETGVQQPQITIYNTAGNAGEDKTVDYDITFNIPANHQVHIKCLGGAPSDANVQYRINGSSMIIDYPYKYRSTYINGLYPKRVLELLVNSLSGGQGVCTSAWLDIVRKDIVITSGDALRGLEGAKLKTSFSDFFKSMNRWGVGCGVVAGNTGLLFEDFAFFFKQDTIMFNLGQVSEAETVFMEDAAFNTISAGYDNQDYTDVNGKFEVNQGQRWGTPILSVTKELDLKSPYRADSLGIELLRINFEQKRTTDSESDNDCFMLNVEKEEHVDGDIIYHKLYRSAYSDFTGKPHPETDFNTELSPKRSILENGAFIRSMLDKLDSKEIVLNDKDKNAEQSTTLAGVTIAEKEPIQIATLKDRLFLPHYATFKTQVDIDILQILDVFPYGKISFEWNDRTWYAFLFDGGVKPATNDVQTWKVIMSPENDLKYFN